MNLLSDMQERLVNKKGFNKLFWIIYTSNFFSKLLIKYANPTAGYSKVKIIKRLAKKYNVDTFIETGTYLGDTVENVKKIFNNIYSIELGRDLAKRAEKRFASDKNIKIMLGDSEQILPLLIKDIKTNILFWLDAHYSRGITTKGRCITPVIGELKAILNNWKAGNVILIDDARLFNGENGFPSLARIKQYLKKVGKFNIVIAHDVIQITEIEINN